MDIKGVIADQMGALTPHDIGGALVSIGCAALVTFAAGLIAFGSRRAEDLRGATVLAALLAAITVVVRGSLPLAVVLVAGTLLVRPRLGEGATGDRLLQLLAVVAGVGCGAGASVITLVLLLPVALLLRWAMGARPN